MNQVRWTVCVLLLVVVLLPSQLLAEEVQVLVTNTADGFKRASTDEELQTLYMENLHADFAPWPSAPGSFNLSALDALLEASIMGGPRPPRHVTLVLCKANRFVGIPLTRQQPALATRRVASILQGLENATRRGVAFPDTAFLLNTWDEPRCKAGGGTQASQRPPPCPMPVFSLIKQWDWAKGVGRQLDVLVPFFNHVYEELTFFPWERKAGKALMRAAIQNGMSPNCTRMWLWRLAQSEPGSRLLDAGITNNLKPGLEVQLVPQVSMADHAKWRYLVAADGFTASCRFGKLLGINSVVLKEVTPWIEYYYRSVKPGVHFVGFTKASALQVLLALEGMGQDKLRSISEAGQQFAYTYLSQHAKALYVRQALLMYNSRFRPGEMEALMSRLDLGSPSGSGVALEKFRMQLMALGSG